MMADLKRRSVWIPDFGGGACHVSVIEESPEQEAQEAKAQSLLESLLDRRANSSTE